jgi:hypothetical protein
MSEDWYEICCFALTFDGFSSNTSAVYNAHEGSTCKLEHGFLTVGELLSRCTRTHAHLTSNSSLHRQRLALSACSHTACFNDIDLCSLPKHAVLSRTRGISPESRNPINRGVRNDLGKAFVRGATERISHVEHSKPSKAVL